MDNQTDRAIDDRRCTIKGPAAHVASTSGLSSLPYFPALGRALGGVTISLVVCYLEIHHRASTPDPEACRGVRNAPIHLDCDQACEDLGISRRTLHICLCCVSTWWKTEEERSRAARAGREFMNPIHSRYGRMKVYSVTGSKTWRPGTIIQLRRNVTHLKNLLQNAGIGILADPVQPSQIPFPK
jgi:hypothetical protein